MSFKSFIKRVGRKFHKIGKGIKKFGKKAIHTASKVGRKVVKFVSDHKDVLSKIPVVGQYVKPGLKIAEQVVGGLELVDSKINDKKLNSDIKGVIDSGRGALQKLRAGDFKGAIQHGHDAKSGISRIAHEQLTPEQMKRVQDAQKRLRTRAGL